MRDDRSFIELKARQRAHALLDEGSYRELLDPFEGVMSPWLGAQGIVPQADDGMVVAKGTINGKPAVVVAIEGAFQGGSMGEVSGAKMANRRGSFTRSEPRSGGDCRYSCGDCGSASLHPGGWHCGRYCGLLRRDVHRGGAV